MTRRKISLPIMLASNGKLQSGNCQFRICIKPFASAMKLPETSILPVGVSRTDMYFNETFNQKCRDNFFSQYPEARNKKIVLWAPTFLENLGLPVFMTG